MTVPLAARRRPRFANRDALAAALESLGEAVALVVDEETVFATTAFAAKAGQEGLPTVVDELIVAGGGLDDGGPDRPVAEVRPLETVDGGWVVRLREPDEGLVLLDPLTGLPNRRAFDARLAEEVARAERTSRPICLVVLDLDHFKLVNDEHGHPVGDAVLVAAGRRLQTAARPGDVIARVGGEEFAWLLPEAQPEDAVAAADRARLALSSEPFCDGGGRRGRRGLGRAARGRTTGRRAARRRRPRGGGRARGGRPGGGARLARAPAGRVAPRRVAARCRQAAAVARRARPSLPAHARRGGARPPASADRRGDRARRARARGFAVDPPPPRALGRRRLSRRAGRRRRPGGCAAARDQRRFRRDDERAAVPRGPLRGAGRGGDRPLRRRPVPPRRGGADPARAGAGSPARDAQSQPRFSRSPASPPMDEQDTDVALVRLAAERRRLPSSAAA